MSMIIKTDAQKIGSCEPILLPGFMKLPELFGVVFVDAADRAFQHFDLRICRNAQPDGTLFDTSNSTQNTTDGINLGAYRQVTHHGFFFLALFALGSDEQEVEHCSKQYDIAYGDQGSAAATGRRRARRCKN